MMIMLMVMMITALFRFLCDCASSSLPHIHLQWSNILQCGLRASFVLSVTGSWHHGPFGFPSQREAEVDLPGDLEPSETELIHQKSFLCALWNWTTKPDLKSASKPWLYTEKQAPGCCMLVYCGVMGFGPFNNSSKAICGGIKVSVTNYINLHARYV